MRRKQKKFTLVELLVAMLVFSIMLVMMMRLFTGAQRVWTASNEKNQVFTNARVAMDMLSTMLQSIYYSPNDGSRFYFRIVQNVAPGMDKIYFASKTGYNLPGKNKIRFLAFQVPNQFDTPYKDDPKYKGYYNQLVMTVACDAAISIDPYNTSDTPYALWFPDYIDQDSNSVDSVDFEEKKADPLYGILDAKIISDKTGADYCRSALLSHVVEFKITPYNKAGGEINTSPWNWLPACIEIRLCVLSDSKFKAWKELASVDTEEGRKAAEKFRRSNQYEFFRRIYNASRWLE